MSTKSVTVSDYEIARLERIDENMKIITELFADTGGTSLKDPLTPEGSTDGVVPVKRNQRRKLRYNQPRSKPRKRGVVMEEIEYDGPVTRSMRNKSTSNDKQPLMDGIEEDMKEFQRTVYKRRKVIIEPEEPIPIDLDGEPCCDKRLLKNVLYNSKQKVYDRVNGSTCHQCRQKTRDQKTICHNKNCQGTKGQFCGSCLKNRYGEDIVQSLQDPEWVCPPCRGKCNCSFCLPKKGRPPTGIMIHIAKEAGYDCVQEYLERSNYDY